MLRFYIDVVLMKMRGYQQCDMMTRQINIMFEGVLLYHVWLLYRS